MLLQNSLLPPHQRMKDQTGKDPTGPYSRPKLLAFIEKKAKEEKDWEQNKQYVKEIKGNKTTFHPYRPVWFVPDQDWCHTILRVDRQT